MSMNNSPIHVKASRHFYLEPAAMNQEKQCHSASIVSTLRNIRRARTVRVGPCSCEYLDPSSSTIAMLARVTSQRARLCISEKPKISTRSCPSLLRSPFSTSERRSTKSFAYLRLLHTSFYTAATFHYESSQRYIYYLYTPHLLALRRILHRHAIPRAPCSALVVAFVASRNCACRLPIPPTWRSHSQGSAPCQPHGSGLPGSRDLR